jgi:hypothetical protein
LRWCLRLDTADGTLDDRFFERPQVEVAAHSLQLLSAVVEVRSPDAVVHAAGDCAVQPQLAPQPSRVD